MGMQGDGNDSFDLYKYGSDWSTKQRLVITYVMEHGLWNCGRVHLLCLCEASIVEWACTSLATYPIALGLNMIKNTVHRSFIDYIYNPGVSKDFEIFQLPKDGRQEMPLEDTHDTSLLATIIVLP